MFNVVFVIGVFLVIFVFVYFFLLDVLLLFVCGVVFAFAS